MNNLLNLVAKIALDSSDYDRGLDNASKKARSFGDVVKGGLAKAGKAALVGVTAAATGIAAITKNAVESYANYEQLVGGVETLFGDSAQRVLNDASAAFKTAGMSMNNYMETSIQSAASLINSLDGDQAKAAELMNMSITDMADNVNKMGTTMEAVQNAYRGFSRGNFMMLDNLALGFSGTKEGMQQLLDKAEEISGVKYDISSYADIVQAIHVVQEDMGIAGTTAKEASETISGSLAAVKSAWQNLVTGIADENADFDTLIDNFVEGIYTAAGNVVPRIEAALAGIGRLVEKLAPVVAETIPKVINDILPSLLNSAVYMVESFLGAVGENLPEVIETVLGFAETVAQRLISLIPVLLRDIADVLRAAIPSLVGVIVGIVDAITDPSTLDAFVGAALEIMVALADGLLDAIPVLLDAIPTIIGNLITAIIGFIPEIVEAGYKLLTALIEDAPNIIATIVNFIPTLVTEIIAGLMDAIPLLIDAGIELFTAIVEDLPTIIENIVEAIPTIITSIVESLVNNIGRIVEAGGRIVIALVEGIVKAIPQLIAIGPQIVKGIADGIKSSLSVISNSANTIAQTVQRRWDDMAKEATAWGRALISDVADGIKKKQSALVKSMQNIGAYIDRFFSKAIANAKVYGNNLMASFSNAINSRRESLYNTFTRVYNDVSTVFNTLVNNARAWGNNILINLQNGVKERFSQLWETISNAGNIIRDVIQAKVDQARTWGRDLINNFIRGLTERWNALKDSVTGFGQMIKDRIGFSEPKEGPLSDFHTYAPDMIDLFVKGLKDNAHLVQNELARTFGTPSIANGGVPQIAGARTATTTNRNLTVILEVDHTQAARAVYKLNNEETVRVGLKMAGGLV